FFFSSRRRHTRSKRDWSSDVCSSDLNRSEALLTELVKQASGDSRLAFSIGMIFVKWERFEQAEKAFNEALEAAPANLDVLYNLRSEERRVGKEGESRRVAASWRESWS